MLNQSFQIGSILYTACGYEQTDVNFYQVIGLVGTATLELMELHQEEIESKPYSYCGYTTPIVNNFKGSSFKVRIKKSGHIKIDGYARPWPGTPIYFSSYA